MYFLPKASWQTNNSSTSFCYRQQQHLTSWLDQTNPGTHGSHTSEQLQPNTFAPSVSSKFLSTPSYGCDRKILLPLYPAPVRALPDYGPSIYGPTHSSQLKLLNPIQNATLPTVTGVLRTSPATSLCTETGIPLLYYRRLLISNLQHPQTTTFNHVFHPLHNLTLITISKPISEVSSTTPSNSTLSSNPLYCSIMALFPSKCWPFTHLIF